MVRRIASCPNQEICTHTFSHYYCLEPGQTPGQFAADIRTARKQLQDWGIPCESIVFPRNQYALDHLAVCASADINVYRGNERSRFYRGVSHDEQGPLRRLGRLADTYLPLTGDNLSRPAAGEGPTNIPSSRLLRAYNRKLKKFDGLKLKRIVRSMNHAAASNSVFHLWWHPHNFGADTAENLEFLSRVLLNFRRLRDSDGMLSATMAEAAANA
jgi:hypothetical protein